MPLFRVAERSAAVRGPESGLQLTRQLAGVDENDFCGGVDPQMIGSGAGDKAEVSPHEFATVLLGH